MSYRLAQKQEQIEHKLIDQVCTRLHQHGWNLPAAFVADYYISLKTNPFVVLTGDIGQAKAAFARCFAEALVGVGSQQYIHIAGSASWPLGTGEGSYYRSLLGRFDSLRFLDLFQEAVAEGNRGKAYFLCLDGLHPGELDYYFARLLRLTADGEKRPALPGAETRQQPGVPTNLYITATVNTSALDYQFDRNVLCHAGVLELPAIEETWDAASAAEAGALPPVGYQRAMVGAAVHSFDAAWSKLTGLLGHAQFAALRPSLAVERLLWREGVVLDEPLLGDVIRYVANSFDLSGHGLFDPHDALHNAQLAFDIQVTKQVHGQMHGGHTSVRY